MTLILEINKLTLLHLMFYLFLLGDGGLAGYFLDDFHLDSAIR